MTRHSDKVEAAGSIPARCTCNEVKMFAIRVLVRNTTPGYVLCVETYVGKNGEHTTDVDAMLQFPDRESAEAHRSRLPDSNNLQVIEV